MSINEDTKVKMIGWRKKKEERFAGASQSGDGGDYIDFRSLSSVR